MADEFDWPTPEAAPVTFTPSTVATDDSWMEIDSIEAPKSKLPYDALRFSCMRGSGRVWACDGRYVAYRPFNHVLDKVANPAFQERIEKFNRAGHFKHLGTFDEVMVFELEPESPWYAKTDEKYIAGQSLWKDIQHAAKLACKRDWVDYRDLLEAMAVGMKAGRDPAFARQQWEDALNQIMIAIYQRGGPLPAEIRAGVENVQRARGYGPKILMATDVAHSGKVVYEGRS
jgi:hypothetical protein